MNLVAMAQKRARLVLAGLAFLLAFGGYALWQIPKESSPDVQIPIMYVVVTLPGVSPSDATTLLVKPMEQELSSIAGVKKIRAAGFQGGANVQIEFDAGFDSKKALSDVRVAIDRAKTNFPPNQPQAQQPIIKEINISLFPVMSVLVYGDVDERTRLMVARKLQDQFKLIPEVLSADIFGDREKQVEILMSPNKMETMGLRADQLLNTLSASNLLVAAGNISDDSGSYPLKVPGVITTPQQLYDLPLKANGGSVVTLKDVAELRYDFSEQKTASYVNGKPSMTIHVVKRIGTNMLETIAKVKAVMKEAEKVLPPGVHLEIIGDKSVRIHDLLNDLTNNVVAAVLLVIAVVMGFLGFRSGFLVGVSVPGSFLGGILAIYLSGLTINVVVLFALILSVGMLVDDAIIVCEYAARRIEEGMSKRDAYREASTRMAWPIMTATMTKIVVFIPLLFWPGIVGQFMRYMPITLICVLTASLIFALLILPVLGTELEKVKRIIVYVGFIVIMATLGFVVLKALGMFIGLVAAIALLSAYTRRPQHRAMLAREDAVEEAKEKQKEETWIEREEEVPTDRWHQAYVTALKKVISKPITTIVVSFLLLMITFGTYKVLGKGVDFFPDTEPEQFSLAVIARGNLSMQDKRNLVKEVEDRVLEYKSQAGGIKVVNSLIGQQQGESTDVDEIGAVQAELEHWKERPSANFIIARLLERTHDIPGILIRTKKESNGPKGAKPINLEIYSTNPETLLQATKLVTDHMNNDPKFVDIASDLPPPTLNWEVQVDKEQAARYGANIALIGSYVQLVTQGARIGTITTSDSNKQVYVMARYPNEYRGLSGLDRIKINTARGSVPLSYFVKKQAVLDEGIIKRTSQRQTQNISAHVAPGVLPATEITNLTAWLKTNLPKGASFEFTGDEENQAKSMAFLAQAFTVAIFMIAAVMLLEFNSFSTCLFILTAVVMSTAGVLIGLMIMGQPFGVVMSGLGVISLAGIIVNNNIVLIDTYDHHRHFKVPPLEAIVLAGAQRLRPVFLTSACTVLGLVPIAMAINIDFVQRAIDIGGPTSQQWVQLATAIAFGMIFATPFTLLVTPCMLIARERYFGHMPHDMGSRGLSGLLNRVVSRAFDRRKAS